MTAVTWEGDFGWQSYVLAGRPDLLNYVHGGDVTWPKIWSFCRRKPAPPESIQRVGGLFHMFLSAAYDRSGCWLDPDGEVYRDLRCWAEFAVEAPEALPEERVLAGLSQLLDGGLISRLYYAAAFATYVEAALDGYAARWPRDRTHLLTLAVSNGGGGSDRASAPESRLLPAYAPDPGRFAALEGDTEWEGCLERLLHRHYASWNQVYVACAPDPELAEALQDAGGEA